MVDSDTRVEGGHRVVAYGRDVVACAGLALYEKGKHEHRKQDQDRNGDGTDPSLADVLESDLLVIDRDLVPVRDVLVDSTQHEHHA